MPLPPEILFHRYFQEDSKPKITAHYWGRYDPNNVPPTEWDRLLSELQAVINAALQAEEQGVARHVQHPPFHMDYIHSDVANALAFNCPEYSFIGITEPLIWKLWELSQAIGRVGVAAFQPVLSQPIDANKLRVVLFRTSLFFIVAHEYTHHVHGHLDRLESLPTLHNEVENCCGNGSLDDQAIEVDADGYAAFIVLRSLFSGDEEHLAISLLNLQQSSTELQDKALFSCFILAVGGFFFTSAPQVINAANVDLCDHPPQAARMDLLMKNALRWATFNRGALCEWMTNERYNVLMNIVATATWGMNGGRDWAEQTAFFGSKEGGDYFNRLSGRMEARMRSLSRLGFDAAEN